MSNGPWEISMKNLGGQMSGCPWSKLLPYISWPVRAVAVWQHFITPPSLPDKIFRGRRARDLAGSYFTLRCRGWKQKYCDHLLVKCFHLDSSLVRSNALGATWHYKASLRSQYCHCWRTGFVHHSDIFRLVHRSILVFWARPFFFHAQFCIKYCSFTLN